MKTWHPAPTLQPTEATTGGETSFSEPFEPVSADEFVFSGVQSRTETNAGTLVVSEKSAHLPQHREVSALL